MKTLVIVVTNLHTGSTSVQGRSTVPAIINMLLAELFTALRSEGYAIDKYLFDYYAFLPYWREVTGEHTYRISIIAHEDTVN